MKLTNWIILISVMGGFVLSSAHATTVANPASVEYVDMQDAKLQYQIDHLEPFVPNSAYTLGQPLCTTTPTASCSGAGDQWGIVIYVDPNPTVSGYTAIAMAVANVSGTVVWGVSPATTTEVGADHYGMYGGISNTEAYTSYCTTNSCLAGSGFEACSAFNAGGFTDWYFPAIGEVMAMFGIAEQFSYGDDAISPPNVQYIYCFIPEFHGKQWLREIGGSTSRYAILIFWFPDRCSGRWRENRSRAFFALCACFVMKSQI